MSLQSNKKWVWPKNKTNLDDLVNTILDLREIDNKEEFLEPNLKDIPDYTHLYGAKKAAKAIIKAIKEDKKIIIHGDYDADGISATSILWEFLYRDLSKFLDKKVDVIPFIPSRTDQGYGLTHSSIDECIALGAGMIITVDCGIRDKELINEYLDKTDLEFVITDHHQVPEDITEDVKYPIVHQRFPDHPYSDVEVCGAFVSFLLIQAIKAEVGIDTEIKEDTKGLDLVALATVTDIMQLRSVNRIVVKYGLRQMKEQKRLGIKSLIEKAEVDINQLDTYHLGFIVGPRINASGRIDTALDAVKLLVSNDTKLCMELASKLDYLNFERQKMTTEAVSEAKELVKDGQKILCILGNNWHEGIVGLVAGKLNEHFYKPTIVATNNNGEIKGSCRSISGFNITNALEQCSEYLERFGGHEQAAGFTVKDGEWENFVKCIEKIAEKEITDEMLTPILNIDLHLSTNDITFKFLDIIKQLEPFGYGNRKPVVGFDNLVIVQKQPLGKVQNHLKLLCKGDGVDLITVLLFRCDEDVDNLQVDDIIDIVGNININSWNGNEQLQVIANEWKYSV
ncbi:MAG: single-stranded-DNA-specific exonuclease RecJ [Candidatus Dojkabacteria bacterium]|nr:single-stranded-DNA-specific exonuclease RecJ [Candidatus Dojkabacteria bacterium]